MRVEILKPPPSGLIPTSWIVSIVGGTLMVYLLLIFWLLNYPLFGPYDPNFPRAANAELASENFDLPVLEIYSDGEVYLSGEPLTLAEVGTALDKIQRIEPGIRFHLEPGTPWVAVRQSIHAARKAGATRIEFTARIAAGLFGAIILESTEALPDLPADATAQTFIDALSGRR